MVVYTRETHVEAPFERVWDFHTHVDGLIAVTPDWMNLQVEGTYGPEGEPSDGSLEIGSVVKLSIQPFGVGPVQTWTSRIVTWEKEEGAALFTDAMIDGPFETWEHIHACYADGDGTRLRDRVVYEFPVGPFGPVVDPMASIPMELIFRFRHRRTKELLE